MIAKNARTRGCSPQNAASDTTKAKPSPTWPDWIQNPTTDRHTWSAAVSKAVLAGIAAADSICCRRLGRHAAAGDHQQALAVVEEAGDVGRDARRHLERLLSIKHKAHYEDVDPTVSEARRAIRAMRAILQLASEA